MLDNYWEFSGQEKKSNFFFELKILQLILGLKKIMWLVLPCPLFRSGFSLNLKWIILCWSRYRIKNLPASRICRYVDQMQNECMQIFTDGSRIQSAGKLGLGCMLLISRFNRTSVCLIICPSSPLNFWQFCAIQKCHLFRFSCGLVCLTRRVINSPPRFDVRNSVLFASD